MRATADADAARGRDAAVKSWKKELRRRAAAGAVRIAKLSRAPRSGKPPPALAASGGGAFFADDGEGGGAACVCPWSVRI